MDLRQPPRQQDGSPYVSPCMFPTGVYLYISGAGDGDNVGDGIKFLAAKDSEGVETVEFQFLDWVLIAGGALCPSGSEVGDWASMEVYCPATVVTPNGGGTGNCNLAEGIIIPAPGNGSYDVDLNSANPVLTPLKDGFWEWDFPNTGKGTVSVGVPGKSGAHLIAADFPLARFVNRVPLSQSGHLEFTIPAIEPKIMLPQWKGKVTIYNSGHTGLKVEWYITSARVRTI